MTSPYRASFICGGINVPASRYRIHPIAESLKADGWLVDVLQGYGQLDQKLRDGPVRKGYRAACRAVRAYRTATLRSSGPVLVQRLGWPWSSWPEQILARRGNGLIFDFDDAVFLGASGSESRARRAALDQIFRSASHVVAGNSWLAQQVNADVPVTVVPTCIDTKIYAPANIQEKIRRPVRIGWIGTGGNLKYLRELVAPLALVRKEFPDFELVICSDTEDREMLRKLNATFVRWSGAGELGFLQSLDIGLMPLADDAWCRGKCSFKIIQYMSVGCPVVASAVGMNNDAVQDGVDGFLVLGDRWVDPLLELLRSRDTRHMFGQSARSHAVRDYDISVAVNLYKPILSNLQQV